MPKKTQPQPLGDRIAELREKRGMSRYALAKSSKVDPSYLGKIESGERDNAGWLYVCRIADALGVSLDELRG
jgi:transcriptional regulator with XRE-family HTH domain